MGCTEHSVGTRKRCIPGLLCMCVSYEHQDATRSVEHVLSEDVFPGRRHSGPSRFLLGDPMAYEGTSVMDNDFQLMP